MTLRSRLQRLERRAPDRGRCSACPPVQLLDMAPEGTALGPRLAPCRSCGRPAEVIAICESVRPVESMTDAELEAIIGIDNPTDDQLWALLRSGEDDGNQT